MPAPRRATRPRKTAGNRAARGARAEDAVVDYLTANGFALLARNVRRGALEIDLVARRGDLAVVVEVRTRGSEKYGGAAASIDWRKRTRIVRATRLLLRTYTQFAQLRVRFDVIVVFDALAKEPQVLWLKHAFECPI